MLHFIKDVKSTTHTHPLGSPYHLRSLQMSTNSRAHSLLISGGHQPRKNPIRAPPAERQRLLENVLIQQHGVAIREPQITNATRPNSWALVWPYLWLKDNKKTHRHFNDPQPHSRPNQSMRRFSLLVENEKKQIEIFIAKESHIERKRERCHNNTSFNHTPKKKQPGQRICYLT